jgi:hypothetical protein
MGRPFIPIRMEAMRFAFVLHHVHKFGNNESDAKVIGVYSSEESAKAAIERLRKEPGFSEFPDNFDISRYEIDKDCWTEGFVAV